MLLLISSFYLALSLPLTNTCTQIKYTHWGPATGQQCFSHSPVEGAISQTASSCLFLSCHLIQPLHPLHTHAQLFPLPRINRHAPFREFDRQERVFACSPGGGLPGYCGKWLRIFLLVRVSFFVALPFGP